MCNVKYESSWSHQKTCSEDCRNSRQAKIWGRYGDKTIPNGTVGAISEITISADLMKKGYAVFRALSQSCLCDVIAIKNNKILKIEVRTGYVDKNKKVSFPHNTHGEIDIYGIYVRAEDKCYYFSNKSKLVEL